MNDIPQPSMELGKRMLQAVGDDCSTAVLVATLFEILFFIELGIGMPPDAFQRQMNAVSLNYLNRYKAKLGQNERK